MLFDEVLKASRSVRQYKSDPLPPQVIHEILDRVVDYAPSACNLQPWKFLVIPQGTLKEQIVPLCKRNVFMQDAPYLIVALADEAHCYKTIGSYMRSDVIDLTIAMTYLMLTAADRGLGTCWIGSFEADKLEKLLGVAYPWRILALTPLGYPVQAVPVRPRKGLAEMVEWRGNPA